MGNSRQLLLASSPEVKIDGNNEKNGTKTDVNIEQVKKDLQEDHHSLSCRLLNQLRSFIMSPDFNIDDDQLLALEIFFLNHMNRLLLPEITTGQSADVPKGYSNENWTLCRESNGRNDSAFIFFIISTQQD